MLLRALCLPVALIGLATLAAYAQTGNPGGPINDNLGEMDYGVCRGTDPKCFHDWPRAKTAQYRVLLYTRTGVSRHANLGPLLPEGLNPALDPRNVVHREMLKIAAENGWHLDYTEDVREMSDLNGYHAIIFFSTSREILDDASKTALRQYMRAGGGFVAIHNAFGTLYTWPYYEGLVGNANFFNHGRVRDGDVNILDSNDTSTKDLPKTWRFRDEWYNLVPFPTKVRFLATVDEKSWGPEDGPQGAPAPQPTPARPPRYPSVVGRLPGHGSFHPVAWCQYYDGGKVWATTLGHDAGIFANDDAVFPGSVAYRKMIIGGIKSVMGAEPFCR
jgi:type 1 glutamine amidotransferase